jgi:hypothetical protein
VPYEEWEVKSLVSENITLESDNEIKYKLLLSNIKPRSPIKPERKIKKLMLSKWILLVLLLGVKPVILVSWMLGYIPYSLHLTADFPNQYQLIDMYTRQTSCLDKFSYRQHI